MTLYDIGRVKIAKNSTIVTGENTNWLINDVKVNDLIILNGEIHEIAQVNSSFELTLSQAYTGENLDDAEYLIIHIAEQIFSVDVAAKLKELIAKISSQQGELSPQVQEHEKFISLWRNLGIFIDEDGDLAQDIEHSGENHNQQQNTNISFENVPVASSEDVQELLHELGMGD